MNAKGRYKLYMTIGVSFLLTTLAVIFMLLKSFSEARLWYLLMLIIFISFVAVAVAFNHVKQTKKRVISLPKTYQDMYIDACEVIVLSGVAKYMSREIKEMLLEIFEHAAAQNRDVNEVIHGDLQMFLKPFIDVSGGKMPLAYWFFYTSFLFIFYMLLMKLYKVVRIGITLDAFKTEPLDMGITVTYAVIAFVFFPWLMLIMKKAAMKQWQGLKRMWVMVPFVIPFGLMSFLILNESEQMRKWLDQPIPLFGSIYTFLIGVLLMLLCLLGIKLVQKHVIKKTLMD